MNVPKMLKQAQQMQNKMQAIQKDLAERTVEGSAAGGKITVPATATGEIRAIRIDPAIVDPADVEMLEDLVLTAVRHAQEERSKLSAAEMQKVASGLGLPPGFGS